MHCRHTHTGNQKHKRACPLYSMQTPWRSFSFYSPSTLHPFDIPCPSGWNLYRSPSSPCGVLGSFYTYQPLIFWNKIPVLLFPFCELKLSVRISFFETCSVFQLNPASRREIRAVMPYRFTRHLIHLSC